MICVENMPPGVHPGSRMADLAALLVELAEPGLALALDTGHANLGEGVVHETVAAGSLLATTHVHDNNGRQDSHLPPGHGTIDWAAWGRIARFHRLHRPDHARMHQASSRRPRKLPAGCAGGAGDSFVGWVKPTGNHV